MKEKLKKAYHMQVEKLLLPRLKVLGWILVAFSILSFGYGLYVDATDITQEETLPEIQTVGIDLTDTTLNKAPSPEEIFNFFSVSIVFGAIGAYCITTSKKRLFLLGNKKRF